MTFVDGDRPTARNPRFVRTRRAGGDAAAAVWKATRRRAFVPGARIGGLAALAVHANLCTNASIVAAVVAVDSGRTDALVIDADETVHRGNCRKKAPASWPPQLGWNCTTLRAAPVAGACVFLASADEVSRRSRRTRVPSAQPPHSIDPSQPSGRGAAFNGNAKRGEFADHLIAGLGRALGLLRIVATAVAAPAEVAGRAVG